MPAPAPVGQRGDGHEGAGQDEGQKAVGAISGEPPLDRGEEHPPDRDHGPERGQRERGDGGRGAELVVMSSWDQLPFMVSQMP